MIQVRGQIVMNGIYKAGTPRVFDPGRLVSSRGSGMVRCGRPPTLHRAGKHLHQDRGIQRLTGGGRVRPGFDARSPAQLRGRPASSRTRTNGRGLFVAAHGAQLSVETIVARARRNLSTFKVPKVVRLVGEDDLPMLPTGKVDRQGLVSLLTPD